MMQQGVNVERDPADVAAARAAAAAATKAGLSNWEGWDDEADVSDEEDRMLVQRSMADADLYRWVVEDPSQQLLDRCNDMHTELLKFESEIPMENAPTEAQVIAILQELDTWHRTQQATLRLLDNSKLGRTFASLRKNKNPVIAGMANALAVKWEEIAQLVILKARHGLEVKRKRIAAEKA